MMIRRLVLFAAVLPLLLTACSAIRKPAPPQVELMALQVEDVSMSHANMLARLRLFNPNNFALKVEGVRLAASLNDIPMAKGSSVSPFEVPVDGKKEVIVRLSSPLWSFLDLAKSLGAENDRVRYRIRGDVNVGGWGVLRGALPIDHSGVITLKDLPSKWR